MCRKRPGLFVCSPLPVILSFEAKPKMQNKKIDFNTVREIALTLPGVEDSTSYGAPSLKVRGRLLTCPAMNRSAEPNTLAVRIGFDTRTELMAADPDVYYLTDHYVNYPAVLVRLSRIHVNALRDLLRMSWVFVNAEAKQGTRKPRKQAGARRTRR